MLSALFVIALIHTDFVIFLINCSLKTFLAFHELKKIYLVVHHVSKSCSLHWITKNGQCNIFASENFCYSYEFKEPC